MVVRPLFRQVLSNMMHSLHVFSHRHVLSQRGDKSCQKVHSLHDMSLRQHDYNLCVCVLLSPHQSVLNWNFVLPRVDYKATAGLFVNYVK